MDETLSGKVAAITGAASGIGLACARRCLAAGARVVLVDRAADQLAALGAELGDRAVPLAVDLTDPAECRADAAADPRARPAGSTSFTPMPAPTSAATSSTATPTPGTGCWP